MDIAKIVITGGPCAGKTTAMSWIQNTYTELGYKVIFVPETATELILSGISPSSLDSNLFYQLHQLKLQLAKEEVYESAAKHLKDVQKVLMVYDRGTMDNKAYMSDEDFETVLCRLNTDTVQLRDRYDAVFHLTTAAKGASAFYTLQNNNARSESPEEAIQIDDRLISVWTGHPHFRVVDNSTDFEGKMKKLILEISSFLGEPEPYETERKYLIEYPDTTILESLPNCHKVEITQVYLLSEKGEEVRVRRRGENGHYIYFKTVKKTVSGLKRVEIENKLTEEEFNTLLKQADPSKMKICKTRYCLSYSGLYFEIDLYPFWKDKAITEIELCDDTIPIVFPDFIHPIKEVTEDIRFKNSSLAVNRGEFDN